MKRLSLILSLLFAVSFTCAAQSSDDSTITISGNVVDEDGKPLNQAIIELIKQDTLFSGAVSDSLGNYALFRNIPSTPTEYTIIVRPSLKQCASFPIRLSNSDHYILKKLTLLSSSNSLKCEHARWIQMNGTNYELIKTAH